MIKKGYALKDMNMKAPNDKEAINLNSKNCYKGVITNPNHG